MVNTYLFIHNHKNPFSYPVDTEHAYPVSWCPILGGIMYAIIESGGKQFRVAEGDMIDVELLEDTSQIKFDKVLFLHSGNSSIVDANALKDCSVHGEFVGQIKGPKVIAFKYKKCKNYRRTVGHRQKYARVKITKISHKVA
jgi:large subunit ribosomal protein L21